jgi:fatty-acyl-CoA synthase
MRYHPVYLWTLPMFHCNGWCFPWTITALAGTHVCLRRVEAGAIYEAIAREGVTHLCGAPVVMNMLLNAGLGLRRSLDRRIEMMTAGAAPPAAVIEWMEGLGFRITHVYGLTEVYGPAVLCAWHDEWDGLPSAERARLKARQGGAIDTQRTAVFLPRLLDRTMRQGSDVGAARSACAMTMALGVKRSASVPNGPERDNIR